MLTKQHLELIKRLLMEGRVNCPGNVTHASDWWLVPFGETLTSPVAMGGLVSQRKSVEPAPCLSRQSCGR